MKAVEEAPGREWVSRYLKADAKASFRGLLRDAEQGRLSPPEDLKPIQDESELFELRWQDIAVQQRVPLTGELQLVHAVVRMYFHEGSATGHYWFRGLHVHEKRFIDNNPEQTRVLQDVEIARAMAMWHAFPELPRMPPSAS